MLTAIVHQIANQAIRLSISADVIELSDISEDVEEEEVKESELIVFQDFESNNLEERTKKSVLIISKQKTSLDIDIKIPVPPPELIRHFCKYLPNKLRENVNTY